MSADPNKKSARTFQCRDVLWETFEQMARELECSIDYLINESMKQYARQRSYSPRTPFPGAVRNESAPGSGSPMSTPGIPAPPPSPPPGYPPAPGPTTGVSMPAAYSSAPIGAGMPPAPPPMVGAPTQPPAPPPMLGAPPAP
ncbi:hypothetical protein QHF83_52235, partial [Polyangium sp. 15x6]|nr:hypothetical protein [Polyangium sp. 15x6]